MLSMSTQFLVPKSCKLSIYSSTSLNVAPECFGFYTDQVQKPWSKRLTKVLKCKKDYHMACKMEKTATNQENNARNSSDLSGDQVPSVRGNTLLSSEDMKCMSVLVQNL